MRFLAAKAISAPIFRPSTRILSQHVFWPAVTMSRQRILEEVRHVSRRVGARAILAAIVISSMPSQKSTLTMVASTVVVLFPTIHLRHQVLLQVAVVRLLHLQQWGAREARVSLRHRPLAPPLQLQPHLRQVSIAPQPHLHAHQPTVPLTVALPVTPMRSTVARNFLAKICPRYMRTPSKHALLLAISMFLVVLSPAVLLVWLLVGVRVTSVAIATSNMQLPRLCSMMVDSVVVGAQPTTPRASLQARRVVAVLRRRHQLVAAILQLLLPQAAAQQQRLLRASAHQRLPRA